MSDSNNNDAGYSVSRQNLNTINRGYEVRNIVVAMGIEGTNRDFEQRYGEFGKYPNRKFKGEKLIDLFKIPNNDNKIMNRAIVKPVLDSEGIYYEYRSKKQHVTYRLRVVETKKEFKKWLETPGVHVIYTGHSRYGRGACFGSWPSDPGDQWEDGTGCTTGNISSDDGLLRLGFPIVGVPVKDLAKHKYHTAPFQGNLEVDDKTCHPEVVKLVPMRRMKFDYSLDTSKIKRNTFEAAHEKEWGYWKWDDGDRCIKIAPDLSLFLSDLKSFIYKGDPNGDLWGYRKRVDGMYRLHILLHAGWKDTHACPWELDKVDIKCKVFCHFGCSSFKHFHPVVRGDDYKNWERTGTGRNEDRFAYFTINPSNKFITPTWLLCLFRYDKRNDFKSWGPSLEWARKRANKILKNKWGQKYKII